jgi:glycosyltransferase involved in cell wall biosynthesis
MLEKNIMNKNIVYIPYKKYPGGPGTFINQLTSNFLDEVYTNSFSLKTKYVLVITYYNPIVLIVLKYILRKKILLRMDGMFVPAFELKYSTIKEILSLYISKFIYLKLADYIVYQGMFVKNIIKSHFGESNKQSFIINNCVSINYSRPDYKLEKRIRIGYWASGIDKTQFLLLLDIELSIYNLGFNSSISIIGPLNFVIDNSILSKLSDRVYLYGNRPTTSVYRFAEKIDIFLMIKGSPYPNTLVETLALGIPVAGIDKKGNKEIITEDVGILFKEVANRKLLINKYTKSILKIIDQYSNYRKNIKVRYDERFNVTLMKKQYLEIWTKGENN